MKTNWGAVLADLRNEQGLSQRELSKLSGVNRSSLRRIEIGEAADLPNIEAILEALGYEFDVHPKRQPQTKDHHHGEDHEPGRHAFH